MVRCLCWTIVKQISGQDLHKFTVVAQRSLCRYSSYKLTNSFSAIKWNEAILHESER